METISLLQLIQATSGLAGRNIHSFLSMDSLLRKSESI